MSDNTVFTTRGHVFHIDPESRKKWLPSAEGPAGISLFYDEQRGVYRLVACDANQKVILNSTMQANMTFTKTSAKFGQWSDKSSGHNVYGVGFSSESDLNKFHEEFNKAKVNLRALDGKKGTEHLSSGIITPRPEFNLTKDPSPSGGGHKRPSSTELRMRSPDGSTQLSPVLPDTPASPTFHSSPTNRDSLQDIDATVDLATKPPPGADEQQVLRYESKRLKAALARSSENAKKWEAELHTLKNNNARLTAALQDSASNVSEWKTQLKSYKEESTRLKQRVRELESKRDGQSDSQSSELEEARRRRTEAERQTRQAQEELETVREDLNQKIEELEGKNQTLRESCAESEERLSQFEEKQLQFEIEYRQAIDEKEKSFEQQAMNDNQFATLKSNIKTKITEISSLIDSK
eukprot:TRINITY_DN7585_c0_g2_i1.p1 TRINITY_DN7585_c0_g2~~TRINITY_DN7585_c0_g2_i1.p1  ORF type:complete len:408 (-),score=97.36 TRINITY_DN7585_c0_g2_i1:162-1385(-)